MLGLPRVVLTCGSDNVGSRRVIERCGGVLDAEYVTPQAAGLVRRYVIALR